jgi:hypothetical protein
MAALRFRTSAPTGVVGRVFGTLFMLAFAGMGGVVTWFLGSSLLPPYRAWLWAETPCLITTSQAWHRPAEGADADPDHAAAGKPYRFDVTYSYERDGGTHRSDVFELGYDGSDDLVAVERLARTYRPGAKARCWVDPAAPDHAVLRRPTLWVLALLLFPLLFVGVGIGGIVAIWRPTSGSGPTQRSSISQQARQSSTGCGVAFFAIFALFGLAFLIPFFGLPLWHILQARSWDAVPCTILDSDVEDHGDTYSVDVVYRYEVAGTEYHGNRYSFFSGSTSGRTGKEEVVAGLPPGSSATCWADPHDPQSSVLDRGPQPMLWFSLIPGIFVLIGLGGIVGVLISAARRPPAGAAAWLPAVAEAGNERFGSPGADGSTPGTLSLRPKTSPVGKLVGAIIVAAIWDGITGTGLWFAVIQPWRQGQSVEGCLVAFLAVFALIGLGLLANIPYQFLALFNPRPQLDLAPAPLTLGQPTVLGWRFAGASHRLKRLMVKLEGREEASYRQGTSSVTAKSVFHRETLLDTVDAGAIAGGQLSFTLPADTMCSFAANHNKVIWTLELDGEIANWPDVDEDFELAIAPALPGAAIS